MRTNLHFKILIGAFILLVLSLSLSHGRIMHVPDDHNTVMEAINAAEAGDTVLVMPGRYIQNINISKSITIASLFLVNGDSAYIDSTEISGDGESSVFDIFGDCQPHFTGLTIRGGRRIHGAAFYLSHKASPVIRHCLITGNSSGIFCSDTSNFILEDSRIFENRSDIGGDAIRCLNNSSPHILRTKITDNSGCGIYLHNQSNAEVVDCLIDGNEAKGLYIWNSIPSIRNTTISRNRDETVGGIYLRSCGVMVISNCTIASNEGDAFGGIACYSSLPMFRDCLITENTGGSVGGVRCAADSRMIFIHSQISNNTSQGSWGGVRVEHSELYMDNSTVSDNFSQQGCSGISLVESRGDFHRCTIYGNFSTCNGGAFFSSMSRVLINHCTITRNVSDSFGGAFYCEGGDSLIITNSILWNNSSPVVYLRSWGNAPPEKPYFSMQYSNLSRGEDNIVRRGPTTEVYGESNITENPCFINNDNNDFHIDENSPCIDAADPHMPFDPDLTVADMGVFFYPQPFMQVSTEYLTFEGVPFLTRDSLALEIHNRGLSVLTLEDVFIRHEFDGFFMTRDYTCTHIAPGEMLPIWIHFQPSCVGEHRAVLFIETNDRNHQREIVRILGHALSVSGETVVNPQKFAILSAYPNPFNSSIRIEYSLPIQSQAHYELIDLRGRVIFHSNAETQSAGNHEIILDGMNLESGTYLLNLKTPAESKLHKIVKIK